jgi:hypothetical protein
MIRIKLDLPEATIDYNSHGILTSVPVPYAPDTIKHLGMRLKITGYVDDMTFFAFKMESPDKQLSTGEQLTLIRALGFKTVPFIVDERTAGDTLISIKEKFKKYNPEWIYAKTGKVLSTPEIVNIISCKWDLVNKGLTLQVTTDKGVFPIVDMRYIEFFQPHGKAKLSDDKLLPYMTTPVTVPIPDKCPKCNNPLKRIQPYPDLPLFFRCTSKFCTQLVMDEPDTQVEPEQEVEVDENSFRPQTESKVLEQPAAEEPVLSEVVETETPVEFTEEVEALGTKEVMEEEPTDTLTHGDSSTTTTNENICLVDVKCESDDVQALIDAGKISVTEDVTEARFLLVKNRRSVSKYIRDAAKEHNLEMKPISDFQ